jgi:hypothetical protein
MASVPSIVCWESSAHRGLVGASIVSLLIYVIGVPAVTFGTVTYARHRDLLKNEKLMRSLGYWYTWYSTFRHQPSVAHARARPPILLCAAAVQNRTLRGGRLQSTLGNWDSTFARSSLRGKPWSRLYAQARPFGSSLAVPAGLAG